MEGEGLHADKIIENKGYFHGVCCTKELSEIRLRVTWLVIPVEPVGVNIRVMFAQAQRQFINPLCRPSVAQVTGVQVIAWNIVNLDFRTGNNGHVCRAETKEEFHLVAVAAKNHRQC